MTQDGYDLRDLPDGTRLVLTPVKNIVSHVGYIGDRRDPCFGNIVTLKNSDEYSRQKPTMFSRAENIVNFRTNESRWWFLDIWVEQVLDIQSEPSEIESPSVEDMLAFIMGDWNGEAEEIV